MPTRRNFIQLASLGTMVISGGTCFRLLGSVDKQNRLEDISNHLLEAWTGALLKLQIADSSKKSEFGGIWCPTCQTVHGRVADSVYPLLHMAHKTQNSKYLDSAIMLYLWMEENVSQADGSWLNDPVDHAWKGITVFTTIALAEALKNHGSLLEPKFRSEIENRLLKSCDYILRNFSMTYGNINYPISASYALALVGTLLDKPEFLAKARYFAHESLKFISVGNHFIFGEGGPMDKASDKGCFSVDLGYNVEESLPSLVLYGKLAGDKELLDALVPVMQTHMEFMLPDGAWDNSWGTRNFKWTYWGSRTTDGCQPAFALMADRDPRFYKVALKSTELLFQTTHEGLLYGGPHYVSHGLKPCVHHTFCHSKSLATILDHGIPFVDTEPDKFQLPRERNYASRFFKDIQTVLISVGDFRATLTVYDREYTMKSGHASGGALTMLWHPRTGPLLSASMTEYQLKEPNNMQPDNDPLSMSLTPRIELKNDRRYTNICDLTAAMEVKNDGNSCCVKSSSSLVDQDQQTPASGSLACETTYTFYPEKVTLEFSAKTVSDQPVRVVLPFISRSGEDIQVISARQIQIKKDKALVKISSDRDLEILPTTGGRIFNFVPGLEAIPLAVNDSGCKIEIEVV